MTNLDLTTIARNKYIIRKYEIPSPLPSNQLITKIKIPDHTKPISVQYVNSMLAVYCIVRAGISQNLNRSEMDVTVLGAGAEFSFEVVNYSGRGYDDREFRFLGTVKEGSFVWHVFYRVLSCPNIDESNG